MNLPVQPLHAFDITMSNLVKNPEEILDAVLSQPKSKSKLLGLLWFPCII